MPQHTREELGRKLLYDIAIGKEAAAHKLIDEGAWLNVKDTDGGIALHKAAAAGRTGILNTLLARTSALDPKDDAGYTPLMYAARLGKTDAVASLLKAGASITARNAIGQSVLDLAKEGGDLRIISMIVDVDVEGRRKLADEWKDAAMHVDHQVTVSKPLQLKIGPKF